MVKQHTKVGTYKTVYSGILYKVQHATATLPHGGKMTYERIVRPQSAMVYAIDDRNRLLLTREFRTHLGRKVWRVPAGRVDEGETPRDTAQRELQEETGFRARSLREFYKEAGSASFDWERHYFLARGLGIDPLPPDDGEDIAVVPTSIPTAFKMVLSGAIEHPSVAYGIARVYGMYRNHTLIRVDSKC